MDGIYVNQEGRARMVQQAYRGGAPIAQSGGGDHPPRKYGAGIPGADPRPAGWVLAVLADEPSAAAEKTLAAGMYRKLAEIFPELTDLNLTGGIADEGFRLHSGVKTDLRFAADISKQPGQHPEKAGRLKLVFTELTFGSEVLSAHSECLRELEPEPAVFMHTREARNLDLVDGELIVIQTETGRLEAQLKVVENMAAGVLVIPRHRKLTWQIFETGALSIAYEQIKKATA